MNHPHSVSIFELFFKKEMEKGRERKPLLWSLETVKDRKSKRRGNSNEVWRSDSFKLGEEETKEGRERLALESQRFEVLKLSLEERDVGVSQAKRSEEEEKRVGVKRIIEEKRRVGFGLYGGQQR